MNTSSVQLCLREVTRIFPAVEPQKLVHALGPLDLDLRRGEFFSVVGPSGCGKSTLLDLIAGLARPTAGTITFEGCPVAGEVPDGIGVVFQEDASFPWLNVYDNAAFALRRAGMPEKDIRERVDPLLAVMGLQSFTGAHSTRRTLVTC